MAPLMHLVLNTSGRGALSQRAHATKASHSNSPGDKESNPESKRKDILFSKESLSGPAKS